MLRSSSLVLLLRTAHLGPTAAVTVLAAALAAGAGVSGARFAALIGAVFCGQLTIGWSNDLIDADRDTAAGRPDKPLALSLRSGASRLAATADSRDGPGESGVRTVRLAIIWAAIGALACSAGIGLSSATLHGFLVVGSGWVYNLRLKGTPASFAPYAIAFGALPTVATLAARAPYVAPIWVWGAGALLGVAAHLLNVLPDLATDAATGVHGLPHRLGARGLRRVAVALLVGATALTLGGASLSFPATLMAAASVAVAALVAWFRNGRWPFRAVIVIALINAVMLSVSLLSAR